MQNVCDVCAGFATGVCLQLCVQKCGCAKFCTFTLLHTFPQFFANKLHQAIILKQFFNLDWNSKHSVLQGSRAWLSMCSCNLQIPILLVTCACVRCISMLAKCVPTTFFYFCIIVRNETDVILFHFQFFAPRQYWNTRK